ncbi:hypothetical protein N0B16_06045 [Chryseobacterium sp. GMJ5]|uniref:Glycosyltransferase RgtA/B/C/D-like domain-containing protein n=1 Tax=Chryseobacterium gilvum TaxID=2976534 RepID=A0ABT2VVG5_9FLAO|nr:hypothetical protein [Chryseobacterium gilvum]MCU7613993.1 hypothetical protein [Chryseobacterium gilvum]
MKIKEKYIQISLVIITVLMTILRFLLNEKGRVTPDSIRFLRFAKVFPTIDNTITPLGYPLSIKFFTFFGSDEFWGSKIVGISSLLFIIFYAWKKDFYLKETVIACSLFSFVSIFSSTLSEAFTLPFVLILLYVSHRTIEGQLNYRKALFYISIILILLYNIRYSALFLVAGTGLFGLLSFRKKYGPIFMYSAAAACVYIIAYKLLFIDYFNENYIQQSLEIGLKPTSTLLPELFSGLATSFNPFVHISNPGGGMINYGIYSVGVLNILLIIFLFTRFTLSESEVYMITIGITGIICTYFVQYFYWIDAIDYRLLAPFSFPVWLVFFKKLFRLFGIKTYIMGALSIVTGMTFTWMSRGFYLENRKEIERYLHSENLEKVPLLFYTDDIENLENVQIAELISTVNPHIDFTEKPGDTLKKTTLTPHKVLQKIKIDKNKYQ